MSFMFLGMVLVFSTGAYPVRAADSGGYGAEEESGGYGSEEDSGGYGAEEESGGYGAEVESGGYGAEEESGGYGAEEESGGYGAEEESGGYGAEEESGGYGAEEESGGYGAEEESGGYGADEDEGKSAAVAPAAKKVVKKVSRKAPAGKKSLPPISFGFVISSLLCGLALGWVLQRGRFCMNTAFRDTIFIKEFTPFRAYLIALMVAIIGSHLLADLGFLTLYRQHFLPVAQIGGGFIFGLGIVLAGGCGSGIWYRVGEGQIASYVAVMGFFIGIATTFDGILSPVLGWMKSIAIPIAGRKDVGLWQLFGDGPIVKWAVIAVLAVIVSISVMPDKPFKLGKQKGYYWSVTGLLVGLIAVACFWASDYFGGFPRGISFTTPTRELFYTVMQADAQAPAYFPAYALGGIKITWGVLFLIGVPLGAYLSARGLREFSWKVPPATELITVFFGSLMMGFGAAAAGGCNMGQGITGAATLSIGSILATIAIILGNWCMVYFKFIKPMQDLD